jgi:hypothetical protein
LQRYGAATGLLAAQLEFRLSSGLANPAQFNWPARIAQVTASEAQPDAVVLFMGANDFNNMRTASGVVVVQTAAWQEEYSRRAAVMMEAAGERGGRLYWVGMPVVRDARRNAVAAITNDTIAAEAAPRPWVRFVDVWGLFAEPDGRYATFRPGAAGEMVRVRQDDGIHLTRAGTNWVAAMVFEELRRDWGF